MVLARIQISKSALDLRTRIVPYPPRDGIPWIRWNVLADFGKISA